MTSSTAVSAVEEDLVAAEVRIAELEAELFAATSTTTTTVPGDMVVWSHETGEYIVEPVIDGMSGWVSHPQAKVDVNGVPLVVTEPVGPDWVRSVDRWTVAWEFLAPEGQGWALPLNEGRNMLMVTATFPDQLTRVDDIVVYHDPNLTRVLGILTGYEPDPPRTMTFDVGPQVQTQDGEYIAVESTETYPVADDAAFKVIGRDGWQHVIDSYGFYEVLDFIQSEGCALCDSGADECCPNQCIFASSDNGEGLQFEIYLNVDGDIQQLTQIYAP